MKPLADTVETGDDFFVEDIAITAIAFDPDEDDVTVWATTLVEEELHFFHLALSFADLSTLLRLAGERGSALDEEVADALSGNRRNGTTSDGEPTALEDLTSQDGQASPDEADTPQEDEAEEGSEPTLLEFLSEERPPVLLPAIALK